MTSEPCAIVVLEFPGCGSSSVETLATTGRVTSKGSRIAKARAALDEFERVWEGTAVGGVDKT